MGQAYCVTLCGQKTEAEELLLQLEMNHEADQPLPKFGKRVKQHIELHPKIKQTYMLYRTPHHTDKKGVKLDLYYMFDYAAYYEGQWKSGFPHGYGRVIYDDGSIYEGCFRRGVAECHQALYIRGNGSFYRGAIKNNKANGYGQLSTMKIFYKGPWVNDMPHGKARQIYSSISFYEGQFSNGVKQGDGIYQWNPQQYYVGKFNKNKLDGYGELITKQYTYKGQFREGKKQGEGELYDNNNHCTYKTKFENNIPAGEGEIIYEDGAKFVGKLNGFFERKGELRLASGKIIDYEMDETREQSDVLLSSFESVQGA